MKYCRIILIAVSCFIGACQEIHLGMTSDELTTVQGWGKPQESTRIIDTKYEVWWYNSAYIDHLIFLKGDEVIGHRKYSPYEKIWETVKQWVLYVEREPLYRDKIAGYLDDIINQRLRIGMATSEVRLSWGAPKKVDSYLSKYGNREEWFYEKSLYEGTSLIFTNDILTEIK